MSELETDLGDSQPNLVFLSRCTLQIRTQKQGGKSHEPKAHDPPGSDKAAHMPESPAPQPEFYTQRPAL